jgi:hypothetical protein
MWDVGVNRLGSACAVYALRVPCGSLLSAVVLKLEVLILAGGSSCAVVVVVVCVGSL